MSGTPKSSLAWTGLSRSVTQTMALGAAVARHARAGDLIALVGELGAGKTQFVRGLASVLAGDDAPLASPTFVMVHEYPPRPVAAGAPGALPGAGAVLVHIDAYRLRSLGDLESIGWELPGAGAHSGGELRRGAVVAIEWADRLGDTLGADLLTVELAHESAQERRVTITASGAWAERFAALRTELDSAIATPAPTVAPALLAAVTHRCPICQAPVVAGSPAFPFCSPRCQTIDLGRWITGRYVISRPVEQ